jgi:hypothetical protein
MGWGEWGGDWGVWACPYEWVNQPACVYTPTHTCICVTFGWSTISAKSRPKSAKGRPHSAKNRPKVDFVKKKKKSTPRLNGSGGVGWEVGCMGLSICQRSTMKKKKKKKSAKGRPKPAKGRPKSAKKSTPFGQRSTLG